MGRHTILCGVETRPHSPLKRRPRYEQVDLFEAMAPDDSVFADNAVLNLLLSMSDCSILRQNNGLRRF